MSAPARLIAADLGKCYLRDCTPVQQLGNRLLGRSHGEPFWALKGLDLQVGPGEAVGVLGRNGSGKSTLMQLLLGTLAPTTGTVTTTVRVAGLLELGAGFNPLFTGRENAILNAQTLGLTADEIAERLPKIADFAGIGDAIDRPVREYSSGMYARLAFAVAIHVDAQVLIIDEILAVGDSEFQGRCHQWMRSFREAGGSLVFVAQDGHLMASICQRALWLDGGAVRLAGPAEDVATAYHAAMLGHWSDVQGSAAEAGSEGDAVFEGPMSVSAGPFRPDAPQHGNGGARVIDVTWHQPGGALITSFAGGEVVDLCIHCQADAPVARPIIGFIFRDERGQNLFGDNTYLATALSPPAMAPGETLSASFRLKFPWLPVGVYSISPSIIEGTQEDHIHLHWLEEALTLQVSESPVSFGLIGVPMLTASLGD